MTSRQVLGFAGAGVFVVFFIACTGGPGDVTAGGVTSPPREQDSVRSSQNGQSDKPNVDLDNPNGTDDEAPAPAPFRCADTTTCGTTQYCVIPCCKAVTIDCYPTDAATCADGYHLATCQGARGCERNPCIPEPAFCTGDITPPPTGCERESATSRTLRCSCN